MSKTDTFQQRLKMLIFCSFFLSIFSCSKTVYSHKDDKGESKFIVYSTTYKYKEKTKDSRFNTWGKYVVKGDSISFLIFNSKKIPYTYFSDNYIKFRSNRNSENMVIKVRDKSEEPLIFAKVILMDSLRRIISNAQTDIDGNAYFRKSPDLFYIDIVYSGYSRFKLRYQSIIGHDIQIVMEQNEVNDGRTDSNLSFQIATALSYKLIDNSKQKSLERDGVVYYNKIKYD